MHKTLQRYNFFLIYEKKNVILHTMKNIRIISPASAIDSQWIHRAQSRLEQWGFSVSVSEHAYGNIGRFSATDEERLADINAAFADPTVDIILCSRGGYGLQRIVDRIVLPQRPVEQWPLLVGFSDITALHSLLSIHGVASLHANMCKDISLLPDDDIALQAERDFLQSLTIPSTLSFTAHHLPTSYHPSPHHDTASSGATTLLHTTSPLNRSGKVVGRLIGGNLSVLYGLQGTPYSLNKIIEKCAEPPILFIEDICENHYHKRNDCEHNKGKRYVDGAENYKRADYLDARHKKFLGAVVSKFGYVKKVACDTRHKRTDLGIVKISERELLQMREEISSHIGLYLRSHYVSDGGHIEECRGVNEL